jgi:hypothetical protein
MAPNPHFIRIEPEFFRQPNRLRSARPENFRSCHHTSEINTSVGISQKYTTSTKLWQRRFLCRDPLDRRASGDETDPAARADRFRSCLHVVRDNGVQYITVAAGGNFQMSYPLGDAVGLRVERIKTAAPAGWRAGAKPRDSCRISRLQLDERGPDALRSDTNRANLQPHRTDQVGVGRDR